MSLSGFLHAGTFFARNLWLSTRIPRVLEKRVNDDLVLGPCTPNFLPGMIELIAEINGERGLSPVRRMLYQIAGSRLCVVLADAKSGRVVGVMFAYFNPRDISERTIHMGFIGLAPEYRGQGLSTVLRRHTYGHFARATWLTGISSRIDLDNHASLVGALKLGYVEQERYFDKELGVERGYFICDLNRYRSHGESHGKV